MGRWLEVFSEGPGSDAAGRRPPLDDGVAPDPLVTASRHLGHDCRGDFPWLNHVRDGSSAYTGGRLWLDARQSGALLAELRRVRRIARREEFFAGMDGRRYLDLWRHGEPPEAFDARLDRIESLLALAADSGGWARLSL